MFRVLAPHFTHAFLTRYSKSTRSVQPERLGELLRANGGLPATLCMTPTDAYNAACEVAEPDDVIVITGSVFLAGELRPLLVAGH
jgi:dihydrofolate synthase/folylpolyglutamate synthase